MTICYKILSFFFLTLTIKLPVSSVHDMLFFLNAFQIAAIAVEL